MNVILRDFIMSEKRNMLIRKFGDINGIGCAFSLSFSHSLPTYPELSFLIVAGFLSHNSLFP